MRSRPAFALLCLFLAVPTAWATTGDAGLGRDASNLVSMADPVALGIPHDGSVGGEADPEDWFKVTPDGTDVFRFKFLSLGRGLPCIQVYDAGLTLVASGGCSAWSSDLTLVAPAQGEAYLRVFSTTTTRDYTFLVEGVDAPDLAVSLSARAGLLPHQVDLVIVVANVGDMPSGYSLQVRNDGGAAYPSCWFEGDLQPGESVTYTARSDAVGGNGYFAQVFINRAVADVDPVNNLARAFYTVGTDRVREQIGWSCGTG